LDKVKERFNPEQDTCTDKIEDRKSYTLDNKYVYGHSRPLPDEAKDEATRYIRVLVNKYPFQLRYLMGLAYWNRFQEAWCDSGDRKKALRSI